MKLFSSLAVSAVSLPILLSHASPIERSVRRQTASYSVVAVDGGSSSGTAATTVTEPASTLPPTTKVEVTTLLSTITLTEVPTPTTLVLTITSTAEAISTETEMVDTTVIDTFMPAAATAAAKSPPISFSTITISPSYIAANTYVSPVTVTVAPSSVPYDDGMWHTWYFHPAATSSTSEAASSTTESSAASSTPAAPNLYTPPYYNFTTPQNWTAPVNYTTNTNTRLRLVR